MPRIVVTPEELRQVAAQFQQCADQTHAMVQQLTAAVRNLDQNWDGLASQKFYQDFAGWEQDMARFVDTLQAIHRQLLTIADRFEAADRPV